MKMLGDLKVPSYCNWLRSTQRAEKRAALAKNLKKRGLLPSESSAAVAPQSFDCSLFFFVLSHGRPQDMGDCRLVGTKSHVKFSMFYPFLCFSINVQGNECEMISCEPPTPAIWYATTPPGPHCPAPVFQARYARANPSRSDRLPMSCPLRQYPAKLYVLR